MMTFAGKRFAPLVTKGLSTMYWLFGGLIVVGAMISFVADMSLADMLLWVNQHFGKSFSVAYLVLLSISGIALFHLHKNDSDVNREYWREYGLQAANGISTLALTFTLLGISLGIGSLSEQTLTPESIQGIIGELTAQFSMAFMTTVVGLPSAALIRAWVAIRYTKHMA
ncbi:hypothetical protein [Agaribacter flavus]|uniref:MotA/TolQ/ExbB proton channel domain-containing protein n=1 Tax=Agaribacter flavus TaxID=1902781 RepID=A0ABV7FQM3_9ALTE